MFKRVGIAAALIAAASLFIVVPAALADSQIAAFDGHNGATVGWASGITTPGDSNHYALEMTVPANAASTGAFAGLVFASTPRFAPSTAPSFKVMSSVAAPAGGSPRLIIAFGNGNLIYAAPDTTGAWATVGGIASDWYESGTASGCADQSAVTYAQAVACNQAQGVSQIYMVDDTPGSSVYVDDVSYNGILITQPSSVSPVQTSRTFLNPSVKVTGSSGSLRAGCGLKHGTCKFSLILRAKKSGHSVKVGTITGKVAAQRTGTLTVKLNQTGQSMLASSHKLVAKVTGQWPKGHGSHRKTITITG